MLKTVELSQSVKTMGVATTYRSGGHNQFGTCPTTCSLNPLKDNKRENIDVEYLEVIVNNIPKRGVSYTYTHFNLDKLKNLKLIEDIKYNKIGKEKGGCYGANGRTNLHWLATQRQAQTESDAEKLKSFIKSLPHGRKIRHHVVGDVGLDE